MDLHINGFTIHAVVPVIRNGAPDTYYIAGVSVEKDEAVCAWTWDLSADHWSQGYYFQAGLPEFGGDLNKALGAAIREAYERAKVLPEPAAALLAWWDGLDEDERALTGVGASNLDD